MQISDAREAAFTALMACERQGAWGDQAIRSASQKLKLSPRDAALAANLCYGVLQNRMLLDFWIGAFSSRPVGKLDLEVRLSLRLGLYQMEFLDRVPDSAAVNESVNLVRRHSHNPAAAGVVNGILRSFRRTSPTPQPERGDLATRYSHPRDLVDLFRGELGDEGELEALLAADNAPAGLCIQVNTGKTTPEDVTVALRDQGARVTPHPWLPGCLLVEHSGNLEQGQAFQDGAFYVQDAAAKLAVLASGVQPGDRVLDACAAPGGKSFAAAIQMGDEGSILSRDLQEKKLSRIRTGACRLGLSSISTAPADARTDVPELHDAFDVVLADVPCSGLGVIRKKPDIRYRNLEEIKALPAVQREILQSLAKCVRPGGVLLYSTCTLLRRENEDVAETFLEEHPDWVLEEFELPHLGHIPGMLTLWPHRDGTDGFFMARLRRGGSRHG